MTLSDTEPQQQPAATKSSKDPVIIDYADLLDPDSDLSSQIDAAFGNNDDSLGILLVRNVPDFPELRRTLLRMTPKLAQLPPAYLEQLEDPESRYMFGWSHGREQMMNGQKDYSKGSFYANPQYDEPTTNEELQHKYPEYCHKNLWPESQLPELRPAFRALCAVMLEVAQLLAKKCDGFLLKTIGKDEYQSGYLYDMICKTRCNKARLLHYFPPPPPPPPKDSAVSNTSSELKDNWCGWHVDHSCLTALTSAMYLDSNLNEVNPSQNAESKPGLYIKSRSGSVTRVEIPPDCLAFQTGEALQISSRNRLAATPHCVTTGSHSSNETEISRNTLALFIQPDWDQDLVPGYKFTQYTDQTLRKHYGY